jgi:hypothetical protein
MYQGASTIMSIAFEWKRSRISSIRKLCCASKLYSASPDWLQLQLIYDRQSVGQSVLVSGVLLGDQFFFLLEIPFRQLWVCNFVAPSLMIGRVCKLLYNCFWALPEQSLLG